MKLDVEKVRRQFPSLQRTDRIFLDNPAGTQVPNLVLERVRECLVESNANLNGSFETSRRVGKVLIDCRQALAEFLNGEPEEIVFGANMTTLTLHLCRSLAADWKEGDNILLSRMAHDANVAPWLRAAREKGVQVRWLDFSPETFHWELDGLGQIDERTRLVAIGWASNLLGTINPVTEVCRAAKAVGAVSFVDAVQYAPHLRPDVQQAECDFLACSAYKFYGPHVGVMWGKRSLLESLDPWKVRPASDLIPNRWETGTLNHEGIAGTLGALEYLRELGRGDWKVAMEVIAEWEHLLVSRLIEGLGSEYKVQGLPPGKDRVPTVALTHAHKDPGELAGELGARGICVWSGHSYAVEVTRRLGLDGQGGVLRVGMAHYNTLDEVDRTLEALLELGGS
jgi:cysteine desulfurase family protein (TIGR01976 family)